MLPLSGFLVSVMISTPHEIRFFEYPSALCLAFGAKKSGLARERDRCTQDVGFSPLLSPYLFIAFMGFFSCRPVKIPSFIRLKWRQSSTWRRPQYKAVGSCHRPDEDRLGKIHSGRWRLLCVARRVRRSRPAVGPTSLSCLGNFSFSLWTVFSG